MALRRDGMALRGVLRAVDLPQARATAGACAWPGWSSTHQRPGTAKDFVFLTLEDETWISNSIVRPDLFDRERMTVIRQPFLLVDGVLQHQDGVLSVRAERVQGSRAAGPWMRTTSTSRQPATWSCDSEQTHGPTLDPCRS